MHTDQPLVKNIFCKYIKEFRSRNEFTKAEMAERLHMDPVSYAAIEREEDGPSGATMILFILQLSKKELPAFLAHFHVLLELE